MLVAPLLGLQFAFKSAFSNVNPSTVHLLRLDSNLSSATNICVASGTAREGKICQQRGRHHDMTLESITCACSSASCTREL